MCPESKAPTPEGECCRISEANGRFVRTQQACRKLRTEAAESWDSEVSEILRRIAAELEEMP